MAPERVQRWRRATQVGFFALFLLAPALDLLRLDLHEAQLWVLGQRWSLGLDALRSGHIGPGEAAWGLVWRALLPAALLVGGFLTLAWHQGRVYCGWLCPHFSVVEGLNGLLHRAIGRYSLWDRHATPRPGHRPDARWWPLFALACALMGFAWSITLLSYLLPPAEVWGRLLRGDPTPNQARFLLIAWALFTAEFALARHLFCRFGCAVGLFQSLVWMANPRGRVVAFARERARACRGCDRPRGSACDSVCPMRLHPRQVKRMAFSCVQCGRCLQACDRSQPWSGQAPLLQWSVGADALREALRARRGGSADAVIAVPAGPAAPVVPALPAAPVGPAVSAGSPGSAGSVGSAGSATSATSAAAAGRMGET